jgi:HEPN domain-containing protein
MDKSTERALSLLRKAREDYHAAACLAADLDASLWTVGFHAQQAVEKAVKAALMGRGVRYPFTHDIAALLKLAHQAGLQLPSGSDDMPYLSPFGTLFRYEDEEWGLPETLNQEHFLGWAEKAVEWAGTIIEADPEQEEKT